MVQPPFLRSGDTVSIVAPGRKLDEEAVIASVSVLKSWGLNVFTGHNLFSTKHSYLSGTDEERLADVQQALDDSSVQAIICARGGYGTTRILDKLDFSGFLKNPKWICGFSDVTALHLKLQSLNVQSIHSIMPVLFSRKDSGNSVESLQNLLFGKPDALTAETFNHNKSGNCSGELIGGNLSLLTDSLGTLSEVHTDNRILIIEEIDEYAYRLDRMLVQLKRAGKLKNLAGLIIGHMTDINEGELPFGESVSEIILNHVREYAYPVAFNFPTGHENPNLAWIQGAKGQLSVTDKKSILSF
jgi:muramoyltetrapeptide carboxypeptidase